MWNDHDHSGAIAQTPVDSSRLPAPAGRLAVFGDSAKLITGGFVGSKGSRVDPPALVPQRTDTTRFSRVEHVNQHVFVHCGEIERREHPSAGWPKLTHRFLAVLARADGMTVVIAEPAWEVVLHEPS